MRLKENLWEIKRDSQVKENLILVINEDDAQ